LQRAIIVTLHYLKSKRRAGMHWIADALWREGWEVVFVTGALSWLSRLRRDFRFAYPVRREAGRLIEVDDGLFSYVWYTRWHPANLRLSVLNRLASPVFKRYGDLPLSGLEDKVAQSDLVIFESSPALLLFERFKRLSPKARYVYRVADDLHVLKNHPTVLEAEQIFAPKFDLVSVPTRSMLKRFEGIDRAVVQPHGINRALFDTKTPNPYDGRWKRNAVFVGKSRSRVEIDESFFEHASRAYPDWGFHLLGEITSVPGGDNVIRYGEITFAETVPYLQHADIALQPRRYVRGAETVSDSLKMIQYTYCELPIVGPRFLAPLRSNVVPYDPGDAESIASALRAAAEFDRGSIDTAGIGSWTDLVRQFVHEAPSKAETGAASS